MFIDLQSVPEFEIRHELPDLFHLGLYKEHSLFECSCFF